MVNIVMLVKNRKELTEQTLKSLTSNTDPSAYNLTIVDDGSDRWTGDAIDGFARAKWAVDNIAYLRIVKSKGIVGLVRNIGADFAQRYWGRGDWLLFLDNDVYLHPGWLEKMLIAASQKNFKILGGCQHPFHQPRRDEGVVIALEKVEVNDPVYWGAQAIAIHSVDAVAGYSMLMSWETWDKYGPFDQHAKGVGQSEDFAICQKVIKDGYRVGYVSPPVLTVTGLTNTLGEKVPGWEQLKAMVPEGVVAE